MKTLISAQNPFGRNRYGFLWEALKASKSSHHLDYGAFDGKTLRELLRTKIIEKGVGVDLNETVVNSQTPEQGFSISKIQKGQPLPFANAHFDSASLLDVIEHVVDQQGILKECLRVLKPGGTLIVTVPGRQMLSFLDIGNWKFVFPKLHKYFYIKRHSKKEYQRRYIDCENGLFGDIEKEKGWHQHFSREELASLLKEAGFSDLRFDGSGYFYRPLMILAYLTPNPLRRFVDHLLRLDEKFFSTTHLFVIASKPMVQSFDQRRVGT